MELGVLNAEVDGGTRLIARLNNSNHAHLIKIHGVDAASECGLSNKKILIPFVGTDVSVTTCPRHSMALLSVARHTPADARARPRSNDLLRSNSTQNKCTHHRALYLHSGAWLLCAVH